MKRVPTWNELPEHVVRLLAGGQVCVVATVDPAGRPDTTVMSWVVARTATELALCVDTRSRAWENLVARPPVALEVLADDVVFGIRGIAHVEKAQMASAPFPSAIVRVEIEEARDHGVQGTHFRGPSYSYDDEKQHRHEFERTIFSELRDG